MHSGTFRREVLNLCAPRCSRVMRQKSLVSRQRLRPFGRNKAGELKYRGKFDDAQTDERQKRELANLRPPYARFAEK